MGFGVYGLMEFGVDDLMDGLMVSSVCMGCVWVGMYE